MQNATKKQPGLLGLRHLALRVSRLSQSRKFYEDFLGFEALWQPDEGSLYLTSGCDNLALHQIAPGESLRQETQTLDHLGIIAENEEVVDRMFKLAKAESISIVKAPKRHRDDSYSFYISDPDGNVIQILYEPHISPMTLAD